MALIDRIPDKPNRLPDDWLYLETSLVTGIDPKVVAADFDEETEEEYARFRRVFGREEESDGTGDDPDPGGTGEPADSRTLTPAR